MIEITVNNGHIFKYAGNITIDTDDKPFITIISDTPVYTIKENPFGWDSFTVDKFWLEDVQSIRGVE